MIHPDTRRLEDLAHVHRAIAATFVALARDHELVQRAAADELAALGYPARSGDGGRGGGGLSQTERDAQRSWQINSARLDLSDTIDAMIDAMRGGWVGATTTSLTTLARIVGVNVATTPPPLECRDGQVGKHAADQWGDPLCHAPAVKSGLCQRHYQAWYRARRDAGIDVSRDHGPAA